MGKENGNHPSSNGMNFFQNPNGTWTTERFLDGNFSDLGDIIPADKTWSGRVETRQTIISTSAFPVISIIEVNPKNENGSSGDH